MAVTTIILAVVSITQVCKKYSISLEQFDRATKVVMNGKAFYILESASQPGVEYQVIWNDEHQALQCKPHNGPACPASEQGVPCYHKRVACAVEEYEQAKVRAIRQRKAEQIEVERSEGYRLEIKMHELETLQAELEVL
jgi:hypothetical protein